MSARNSSRGKLQRRVERKLKDHARAAVAQLAVDPEALASSMGISLEEAEAMVARGLSAPKLFNREAQRRAKFRPGTLR